MLPSTAGARPGKRKMMFSPYSFMPRLLPERKPSPRPTSSNSDPTPQAIPNMVRKERSLCAHKVRKICPRMSSTVRIGRQVLAIPILHGTNTAVSDIVLVLQRGNDRNPRIFKGMRASFAGIDGPGGGRLASCKSSCKLKRRRLLRNLQRGQYLRNLVHCRPGQLSFTAGV